MVLLRPGPAGLEVLLTRRPSTMAFGPGVHVFPGGRVDPADSAPEVLAGAGLSPVAAGERMGIGLEPDDLLGPTQALAHVVAAIRETAEETGIRIAGADLIPMTRWVTPASMPRRFDVRFFAALVPPGTEADLGSAEIADARWLTPSAALAGAANGRLDLWQPTFVTLQQLVGLGDAAEIRSAFAPGSGRGGPLIERLRPDLARVTAVWAAGIPGRRATGWLVGRRDVVVVDPADPTGRTLDAILAELAATGARPAGVVVTGLAPEQHAGVEMLAHGLRLPVAAATGVVPWAPYSATALDPEDPLPFGEPGWSVDRLSGLG